MINLLDVMVPMRSGSHRGVHAPGGVTYPAVTSNKLRKGTKCVCVHVTMYKSIFQDTVNLQIALQSISIT